MRLVLVDDHPIVLSGLDRLFASAPHAEVVARCHSGAEALSVTRALCPDLLLLDLKLPDMSGLDVLRTIREERLPVRVVILSAAAMAHDIAAARRLGADGLLYKDLAPNDLIMEVSRAAAGLKPFPADVPVTSPNGPRFDALSAREHEIIAAVGEGLRNRAIAERLGITEGTVKLHLHHIYEKVGVSGRVELLMAARDAGVDYHRRA